MKLKNNITALLAALGFLTSCSDDVTSPTYTVGEAINAITLRAGISEGGEGVMTRAYNPEANHGSHVKFTPGTALTLRVDGVWKEKADGTLSHGSISSGNVKQTTTAAIGAVVDGTDNKHNSVIFTSAQQLYWDDYGSADPANMSTTDGGTVTDGTDGRGRGLDIFAVAVDGVTTAPEVSSWTTLPWSLVADQTNGWSTKDLLTSNNVKKTTDEDTTNPYKFDDRDAGKLLEFTHAMTKITVNLTAGEGFPGYATDPETAKFENAPKVTLLGFNYTGSVSVEAKTSTPMGGSTTNIEAYRDNGVDWISGGQHISQFTALVFPGNQFEDNTDILKLEVDGNTLYVNATKINVANTETNNTFEQGKNYIFNILYNKTGIVVTATVTNWVDVNSEEDKPEININYAYGHVPGTAFEQGFTLYRSTTVDGSYIGTGDKANVSYADSKYTMTPQLYWPTHSTHYFFRGVWPTVGSSEGPAAEKVHENTVDVVNEAYNKNHYPSDLMIARPLNDAESATDEQCKVEAHKDGSGNNPAGICATTGDIRMNFRYMMSQIKVELTSSADDADDHITFDDNTKVEIIGGYKDGAIKLSDCTVDFTGKTEANYQLHNKAVDDYDSYHDAIIPQNLTDGLKFRITTQNANGTTDTYEAVIKNIKVSEGSNPAALISAWESGKAYTYTLKITKTAINVTATLKDWVTVTASDNVWF